jgi:hypothetical protein
MERGGLMPTKNPRVNVTLSEIDLEIIHLLATRWDMSVSSAIKKILEDWIEDYEDMVLAQRAEKSYDEWISNGKVTISHEEMCRKLSIK